MDANRFLEKHIDLEEIDQSVQDILDLAATGHDQALSRKFNIWSMLAMSFCALGTWSAFAQDLSSGLVNGGPIDIIWGVCLVSICNLCVGLSLGEMCSSMPTTLGQAYWTYRLWEGPWGRFCSYMCAWITTFGWWTITASQVAFMGQFLLQMKVIVDHDWAPANTGYVQFLMYVGVTLFFTSVNVVSCRRDWWLPWLNNFVGGCFVVLFFVFSLALLIAVGVRSDLKFQPPSFTFGKWINLTGWADGLVFFLGLLQGAYGLTAYDSTLHMIEELPRPRKNGPLVINLSIIIGGTSGICFMIICLFCIQNTDKVINPPTGLPFVELMLQTVGLKATLSMISLFIFNGLGQGTVMLTAASRLTWGFARDGGLPWSDYLAHIDKTWKAPVRALWAQGLIISLVGVLYMFSTTVLQAILSVSTIALTISYTIPILTLVIVGRDKLPPASIRLGRWGLLINWVSLIYCSVTTVLFFFPYSPRPTASDMNYAIAVFAVMIIVAIFFWFVRGKETYLQTNAAILEMEHARQLESVPEMQIGLEPENANRDKKSD
ncbi:amino acid permease family protein [Penicillium lagena]|uniref:amino acid permease family protein n=1 Tax=Penicillium lagena TaxID=94218 RepID=UPI00253FF577|nr:amino acid permease family protein [Penicillium lagena]KAJ5612913.1 amino acid permease family protein [Penicillium lagena]